MLNLDFKYIYAYIDVHAYDNILLTWACFGIKMFSSFTIKSQPMTDIVFSLIKDELQMNNIIVHIFTYLFIYVLQLINLSNFIYLALSFLILFNKTLTVSIIEYSLSSRENVQVYFNNNPVTSDSQHFYLDCLLLVQFY